jgi:hypothetical protein
VKRRILICLIPVMLTFALNLFSQRGQPEQSGMPLHTVSLVRVIANPGSFDGQRLRIIGYLAANGLDRAEGVYLSEVDAHNFILSNSVDLLIEVSSLKSLAGKYVVFSGTYHATATQTGDNGYFDQIRDMREWNAGDARK